MARCALASWAIFAVLPSAGALTMNHPPLPPFVERVQCQMQPHAHWKPFVMLMQEASGSSWAVQLLQGHSRIVADGEVFNDIIDEQDANAQCQFWNLKTAPKPMLHSVETGQCEEERGPCVECLLKDKNVSSVKAVGFKQTFPYCMGMEVTLEHAKKCAKGSWGKSENIGYGPYADVTFALQSRLISLVKPKIICQTRWNAYDWAISKYFMIELVKVCGSKAYNRGHDPATDRCMDKRMSQPWTFDLDAFRKLLEKGEAQFKRAEMMCEAYKELGYDTYVMTYEDMMANPEEAYRKVQSFLLGGHQYYERSRETAVQKRTKGDLKDMITNFHNLEEDAKSTKGGRFKKFVDESLNK